MNWAAVGVIVSVLTLAGAVIFHLFKTTWWMATLSSSLEGVRSAVEKIENRMARYEAEHYTKSDASRDFAIRDEQIKAAHRRLDDLKR